MAYQVPPRWNHGDITVAAARMNKYSDALNAIYAVRGDVSVSIATLAGQSEAVFTNIHRERYLYFISDGSIDDPAGIGDSVSISEVAGTFTAYDLDTVSWLQYGDLYEVSGVSWCAEDAAVATGVAP